MKEMQILVLLDQESELGSRVDPREISGDPGPHRIKPQRLSSALASWGSPCSPASPINQLGPTSSVKAPGRPDGRPGGASSGFLPASERQRPLDYASLDAVGSMLGSAGVVVLNDSVNMADAARR